MPHFIHTIFFLGHREVISRCFLFALYGKNQVLFVCFFRQATPPQATRQKAKIYAYCRRWLRIAHFFCNFIALFQYL